jgi:hypothetical protein
VDYSGYTFDPPPVCPPNQHSTYQLADGTYTETCQTCGLDLVDSDPEEEYLWQLRLDDAEELG